MRLFHILSFIFIISLVNPAQAELSPPELHQQVLQIQREVERLKQHFQIQKTASPAPIQAIFSPRHLWHKTYELFIKINILREKQDLPILQPPVLSPSKQMSLIDLQEQNQRLLLELKLIQEYLGIEAEPKPTGPHAAEENEDSIGNFTLTDDYNILHQASYTLDLINGSYITPSEVFAETMRIMADVDVFIATLGLEDDSMPPPKDPDARPEDVFQMGLQVLAEMRYLHGIANLKTLDFYALQSMQSISPSEVFMLTGIILAELQPLKAHMRLKHHFTEPPRRYEGRLPADVLQVMGWILKKLQNARSQMAIHQMR